MGGAVKRLQKEWCQLCMNSGLDNSEYSTGPVDGDLFYWRNFIIGPKGTPYEGGVFTVDIHFPALYPFKPPKCNMVTSIYHPNINSSGCINLDILHEKWSPALTAKHILSAIRYHF